MKTATKHILMFCLFQAVLCRDFSIDLPNRIEALSGLCVLIPCRFEVEPEYDEELLFDPRGMWYKNGSGVKYKIFSSKPSDANLIEGEIVGDLRMKNCTTVFYNVTESDSTSYYFRIVSGKLKYIYINPVYIGVRASPPSPSITLYKEDQGEVEGQNEVAEGSSVRLICSARAPCPSNPPTVAFIILPDENQNGSFSSSQLNFTASHLHHGLNVTCSATYQLENSTTQSAHTSLTLQVQYAPKNVTIAASPSASVLLGGSASLRCSSDANPVVLNYTWYRENGELIGMGENLTLNQTDHKHHGLYYCRAHNQHGDQNSSLLLDVQYAPHISHASRCNSIQYLVVCFCEVHGNPFPKLEWQLSGKPVLPSGSVPMWEGSLGGSGLRSFISIHKPQADALPTLLCVGTNKLGIDIHLFNPLIEENASTFQWPYLVLPLYLVLLFCLVLLLCVVVAGVLICKLKRLSQKVKDLKRGYAYSALQLCPQTSDYEPLQTTAERSVNEYKE